MTKYVYDFTEADRTMSDLLGGKGANLSEMTKLGLPVPPGFTITTEACRAYLAQGSEPAEMAEQVKAALAATEKAAGRKLGDPNDPLLVSVRSGAKFSMPGMMETVLNVGLTDATLPGLIATTGNERFALDSYRRLIAMFGKTVMGISGEEFEHALEEVKKSAGVTHDVELTAENLKTVIEKFKAIFAKATGREFPQDVNEQIDLAIKAVFNSWNTDRAKLYRRQERIPEDLGTAVNICTMVFGNRGDDSGTGVAFTRDPASGHSGVYGDWLTNAQGEDVVAGIRNTLKLEDMGDLLPEAHTELLEVMATLEKHYRDLCDIEFTVENRKLWMLQTRVGKRTPAAAFRIAVQLVQEGKISEEEALQRVTGAQLMHLMFPRFVGASDRTLITKAIAASPGAAVGQVAFSSERAVEMAAEGKQVILVRKETNPDDLAGMVASVGILTSRGGKTSHAAVVARGMGKTAVCGAEKLDVDTGARVASTKDGVTIQEGDVISIDGTSGDVFLGEVAVTASSVTQYFEGELTAEQIAADELVQAVDFLMKAADRVRRLGVRANADTGEDAARARRFGAQGIGLARTEHMFLGTRRESVERLILAETEAGRKAALDALLEPQIQDFTEILESMDGLPVVVRLIDPPLHEFLPNFTELSVKVALDEARGGANDADKRLLAAVGRMHESNPMLGLRGVRLGLMFPGLFALQVRAIAEAAAKLSKAGKHPHPEIMIPLVGTARELDPVKAEALGVVAEVAAKHGIELNIPIGTMIELPRAAITAGRIAESAEFFSFGTNDLTQTTWGFSRDDVEGAFFSTYIDLGVFAVSPFESIDVKGVGQLVKMAAEAGRKVRPDISLGVCGEHGGDPASIHFFDEVGLDYVSCSPFRVPVARLEAARATLGHRSVTNNA